VPDPMLTRDSPALALTRHFFDSLFDLGFLSDAGIESLKRVLLGCLAGAVAIGLLLTRVFMTKYAALSSAPADVYLRAVVADHAFLMAIPMWLVAGGVGLVGHSLFPNQMDFRVLMAEPLSRSTIFGAKLASLLLFVSLVVIGAHIALIPLLALTLGGGGRHRVGRRRSAGLHLLERVREPVRGAGGRGPAWNAGALCAARPDAGVFGHGEERAHRRPRAVIALHHAAARLGQCVCRGRMVVAMGAAGLVRRARAAVAGRCEPRAARDAGRRGDGDRRRHLRGELRAVVSALRSRGAAALGQPDGASWAPVSATVDRACILAESDRPVRLDHDAPQHPAPGAGRRLPGGLGRLRAERIAER
jgi:hypothetical protein